MPRKASDSNFTWEHFAGTINKDLADVLGNFVNRVTKFLRRPLRRSKVPGRERLWRRGKSPDRRSLDRRVAQYTEFLAGSEFRKAMGELRAIWVAGNEYLTRAAPWTLIKTDRARAAVGVRMGLNLVHIFAHLCWPVMPVMAKKIHEAIQPIGYEGEGADPLGGDGHGEGTGPARSRSADPSLRCAVRQDHRGAGGRVESEIRRVAERFAVGKRNGPVDHFERCNAASTGERPDESSGQSRVGERRETDAAE